MIFLHISHSRLSEAMGVDEKSILEKVLKIRYYRQDNTKKKIKKINNNLQVTCPQLFMPAGNDGDSVKVAKNHQNKVKL